MLGLLGKSVVMLLGIVVSGVFAATPSTTYSNAVSTETVAPQELGSTSSAGLFVYSLNVCTVIHSTVCQPSLSTGATAPASGAASSAAAAAGGSPYGPSPSSAAPNPAASQPAATSAAAAATPAASSASEYAGSSSEATATESSALTTGESSQLSPTSSQTQQPTGSHTSHLPTSTGASNIISMRRGVAVGAAAMAVALLF